MCWPEVVLTVPDNPVPAVILTPVISPPTFVHAEPSYTFSWLSIVLNIIQPAVWPDEGSVASFWTTAFYNSFLFKSMSVKYESAIVY